MALVTDGLINQLDAEYVRDVGGFVNGQNLIGAFLPDSVDADGWYGSDGYDCYLRDNAITIRPSLYFNTGVISPQNTNKYLTYENLTVIIAARRQGPAWGNQWMGLYSSWFNYNNNGASIFAITNNANVGGFNRWGTYGGITTTQSTSAMDVDVPVVLSTTFTSSGSGAFYTNGSNSGTYTSTKDQAYFGIGGLLPAKGSFVGDVFEVLVYNRILSEAEIQDSTNYLINKWFFYPSPTPSVTPTPTPTVTPSISITPTPSITPSLTPTSTPSVTPTATPSITPSETPSVTPSLTPSVTPSETPSVTPSITPSLTPSVTPTTTPSITPSETPSVTPSITPSETPTPTPSVTITPSETPSVTPSITLTPSVTPSSSSPPESGIVTDGLQLFLDAADTDSYPGSGTTWIDLSPNAYSTTLVGAPTFNTTYFTFDGTTEYVDTNQSIGSETFSVGAWFRTSAAGIKMILSKETTAGWPWNYRIWLNGGQIIGDVAQTGGTSTSISTTLTNYNNGSWYYVMYTRDDSNQYLYVNGAEVKTTPDTLTGTIINAQEVWFGRSAFTQGGASPSGSYQYTGDIGQLFIYNRVLSASEILQNYNATKDTFIPPSPTPTATPTPTPSVTPSLTPTVTVTPSVTPSLTPSVTPAVTVTPTITPSVTPSISITPTITPSISITPSITPTPGLDTIRAALTGAATLTAYDAAPADTWIRIQGGEYAALMVNVANAVKYWMIDTAMQLSSSGGWSANFAQVLSADGVSAIGPVPTNSYLIAFSTRAPGSSGSVAILSATSYKGLYSPVGTYVSAPAAGTNINYYYVRKTPVLSFTSNTHLGIRYTVTVPLVITTIKSGGYDDTVPLSSWSSWDNTFIPIQAIATTTKGW